MCKGTGRINVYSGDGATDEFWEAQGQTSAGWDELPEHEENREQAYRRGYIAGFQVAWSNVGAQGLANRMNKHVYGKLIPWSKQAHQTFECRDGKIVVIE